MNEKQIIIVGAGGQGKENFSYIRDLAAQGERVRVCCFIDEDKTAGPIGEIKILVGFKELESLLKEQVDTIFYYITATGDNKVRMEFVKRIENLEVKNLVPWTLIHPQTILGYDIEIGEGTCLAPGSIITTRSKIGKHCILNINVSVSHDCKIGNFVNINPGAIICGNVNIGEGCYIGTGATIIDKVSIGDWTVIGAGAVVIGDIPSHVTAVGVPARVIKHHSI